MKKASEILLELQDQVKYLISISNNQNQMLKIIASTLNKQNSEVTELENYDYNVIKSSEIIKADGNDAIALKIKHAEQQNKNSVFEKMLIESGVEDEDEPKIDRGYSRGDRVNTTTKAVSVSQLLVDSNSKPVALATVKITNKLGKTIKSARSNPIGKWIAVLDPGEYDVHVVRKFVADNSQKTLESKYKINVINPGNDKLEIEQKVI